MLIKKSASLFYKIDSAGDSLQSIGIRNGIIDSK